MERKNKKAGMSPENEKFIRIFAAIYLPIICLALIGLVIIMVKGEEKHLPFILTYAAVVLLICLSILFVFLWVEKREPQFILSKQYAYLLQDAWADAEEFETVDDETGITYTVQKNGLKIVFPVPDDYEQVFDEAPENVEFLPWDRTRFALATSNARKQVKMALAVLDVSTAQIDEDGATSYEEPFFVPLDERLVRAIKGLGLEEKTDDGWVYLFYNPKDAIEQIYKHGYVRVLHDKQTGKRLSEEDWEKGKN